MARGPSRSDPGFRVIVALTDQFTAPINRVNRSIAESTAKLRAMAAVPGAIARASGLDRVGGAIANLGGAVGNLRNQIAGAIAPFTRLLAIGGGIGLVAATANALKLGDEMIRLADVTGLSVESIQRLQYAAKQTGVSAEAMTGSFSKLHKAITAGRSGDKTMVKVFRELGVSVADLTNLAPDEVFLRVAQAVADITDPTHRAAVAMKVFGKSGTELLPTLLKGADGIRELGDELAATGGIMSEETARRAKAFNDVMLKMQQYVQGIAFQVLDALLPAMTKAVAKMDAWLSVNREWLAAEVVSVVKDIVAGVRAFGNIMGKVITVAKQFQPVWETVTNVLGKGNVILLAFTATVAPGIIGALFGVGKAMVALATTSFPVLLTGLGLIGKGIATLTALLLANPVVLVITAIVAAIAIAAYLIYTYWDEIVAAFKWAWETISEFFSNSVDRISEWVADVKAWFGRVSDVIKEALTGPLEWIKAQWNALVAFFDKTIARITGLFSSIGGAISSAGSAVSNAGGWVGKQLGFGGKGTPAGAPMMPSMPGIGAMAGGGESHSVIDVNFANAPPGTRVSERSGGGADVNLDMQYGGGPSPSLAY